MKNNVEINQPKKRSTAKVNRQWLWLSIAPSILILLVLTVFPIFNLIGLSLHAVEWEDGSAIYNFVGMKNFIDLFEQDPVFWIGVKNTIIFSTFAVILQMLLGFSMALAVSRAGQYGRGVLTTIFLLPIVLPPIVIGAMWRLLMGREFGALNGIVTSLGFEPIDWLGNPSLALASVIFVDVWHWTPFVFLLILAGLESLDQQVFEAARLDVKSFWQELWHITLPLMMPTILITMVLRIILSFKVFDEIYLLTSGGPGTATEVVNFTIYRVFFGQDRVGAGSAMSIVTLVGLVLLIAFSQVIMQRFRKGSST